MTYLLDANVFIEAARRYYGFDLVPQFWEWIMAAHDRGLVMTVQKVADEIAPGDDLHDWFSRLPSSFVEPVTSRRYFGKLAISRSGRKAATSSRLR